MSDEEGFLRKSLLVLGGLLVWAAHFGAVYVFNALACARGFHTAQVFGTAIVPAAVGAITVVAVAAIIALLLAALWRNAPLRVAHRDRPVDNFLRFLAASLAALSLLAILWAALPAFLISPCG